MSWKKITLYKYQRIEEINARVDYDELDKTLFTACEVFDLTEAQLNARGAKYANKLIKKVGGIFSSEVTATASPRIGKYKMLYDVSAFTFGQYIEIAFFAQTAIRSTHYILASACRRPYRKFTSEGHPARAAYFLMMPMEKTVGALRFILEQFDAFNKEYKTLFGLDGDAHSEKAKSDRFNKRYGWIYSASAIAEYQRIPLNDVYGLPVRQAFNDLAYLKEKVKYEIRERDRLLKEHKLQNNA